MPSSEIPRLEFVSASEAPIEVASSPSISDISSASSSEPQQVHATPLFRVLALPAPDPIQPPGQEELERRLPGYRRIVLPREVTLIELLKECSGVTTDDEVLQIREAKLRVVAERVGLRRLHVLTPRLKKLILDGSALTSLRDLGIDLVHLKILSVKRCGLTSLDGVWGLGALRELYAPGNKVQDLYPLSALQKLHTLDLSENPISESTRLWTLGVCSSLRKLSLRGCPASNDPQYRAKVTSTLPLLVYLDDEPIRANLNFDSSDEIFGLSSSSDSEPECEPETSTSLSECVHHQANSENHNLPSLASEDGKDDSLRTKENIAKLERIRRRPATTEGAGTRPRINLPPRPHTARDHEDTEVTSRLEIMNTLLDDEWRCTGSNLTSRAAVCGNLALALRRGRPSTSRCRFNVADDVMNKNELLSSINKMEPSDRTIATEIPVFPSSEDWEKFRRETGIDINFDFDERPKSVDPLAALEKLERIEKETWERMRKMNVDDDINLQGLVDLIRPTRLEYDKLSYVSSEINSRTISSESLHLDDLEDIGLPNAKLGE